MLSLRYFFQSS